MLAIPYRVAAMSAMCLFMLPGSSIAQRPSAIAAAHPNDAADRLRFSFYAYDRGLPLDAVLRPLDSDAYRVRYSLAYDSIHDQRVTAILALPSRYRPPYPAVLLVHGSGGNKDTSYINWSSDTLAASGFASLSIDTQYHGDRARPGRSGDIHMPDSYTMRDAWVQSVVDLRRAVDFLSSRRDIDSARIGCLGFSQGAMLAGVLGGVDARVACFCLAVPGGGLVDIARHIDRYPVIKAHWPMQVTPSTLRTIEDIAAVTDPIYFVRRIAPRPLLIIVAKYDEIIPPEASKAIIRAAHASPSQVKQWDSGHVLHPNALFDIRDFFRAHLRRAAARRTDPAMVRTRG